MGNEHNVFAHGGLTRRDWLKVTGAATAGLLSAGSWGSAALGARMQSGPEGRAAANEAIIGQIGDPTTLDIIQRAADVASTEIVGQIYSELLHYNYETGQLEPELALEWRAKDPLTWELRLREGVQFHKDYGEFTAEDVEFNVNYTIENQALRANRFRFVKGARATGTYTVEYDLEFPFAPFEISTLRGIAGQMVSKRAYEEMGEDEFARNPIATGPWELEAWRPGEVVLTRNQAYFKEGLPHLDRLTFIPVPDAFVRRTRIEAGEIDFMGQPDYQDLEALRENSDLTVIGVTGLNWDYIAFNLEDPSLPFQSQEVRQAISYAINRQAIVDNVYLGEATPADSPLPPGFLGHVEGPIMYPYEGDLDRARALMEQAGMADGFTATCITSEKPNLRREVQIVADQLREININLEIQGLDEATYNSRRDTTDFEMELEDISIVSTDPDDALTNFQHSEGNINQGWVSEEVDTLIDDARTMVGDDEGRAEKYKRVVDLTLEGAGYHYLVHTNVFRIMQRNLVDFQETPYEQSIFLETLRWQAE